MGTAIGLRTDYTGTDLRKAAKRSRDAHKVRRLLALAAVYGGAYRSEAAAVGGVDRQTLGDWVWWFNEEGPDGLIDGKAPGKARKLNDSQRKALADIVERGPYPSVDGVVRWRLVDLQAWIREEFGISISETTVSRELKALGFRKLTARPRAHDANELAQEQKKSPRSAGPYPGEGRLGRSTGNLVSGRGAHRTEEQDYPALGPARHTPQRPA